MELKVRLLRSVVESANTFTPGGSPIRVITTPASKPAMTVGNIKLCVKPSEVSDYLASIADELESPSSECRAELKLVNAYLAKTFPGWKLEILTFDMQSDIRLTNGNLVINASWYDTGMSYGTKFAEFTAVLPDGSVHTANGDGDNDAGDDYYIFAMQVLLLDYVKSVYK